MESMRDVDRVMEREVKKGSTPLKFEHLGFGDYSYNEITSKEKLLQVLSYLLRIGEYEPFAGKTIGNNVYMDMRGKKAVFKRTRLTYMREIIYLHQLSGWQRSISRTMRGRCIWKQSDVSLPYVRKNWKSADTIIKARTPMPL